MGFERRDRVGGLWSYSPDPSYTSVIQETVANVSKFVVSHKFILQYSFAANNASQSGFSDFPVPKGTSQQQTWVCAFLSFNVDAELPPYMTGAQVEKFFEAYASHFQLDQHIRFKTTVHKVLRDSADRGWNVHATGPDGHDEVLHFDKVVFGTGSETVPVWPPMPRREEFKGIVIHGQSYRKYIAASTPCTKQCRG